MDEELLKTAHYCGTQGKTFEQTVQHMFPDMDKYKNKVLVHIVVGLYYVEDAELFILSTKKDLKIQYLANEEIYWGSFEGKHSDSSCSFRKAYAGYEDDPWKIALHVKQHGTPSTWSDFDVDPYDPGEEDFGDAVFPVVEQSDPKYADRYNSVTDEILPGDLGSKKTAESSEKTAESSDDDDINEESDSSDTIDLTDEN